MKLKDHIHHTTQTTSAGSSETSQAPKGSPIEDKFHDNLQTFETKIARAKKMGQEWVETSKEMIDYVMPQGWTDYAIYKDVKICEFGRTSEIQSEIDMPLYQRQFGGKEGIVET